MNMPMLTGNRRPQNIAALFLYGAGACAYLAIDIMVASWFAPSEIAEWAAIRSLVGLSGVLCLLGLDYVFVRSPDSSRRILKLAAVQVPIIAVPIGWLISAAGFLGAPWLTIGICVGSALTIAIYQYHRTNLNPLVAQVAYQSWKLALALLVLAAVLFPFAIEISRATMVVLLGCAGTMVLPLIRPPARGLGGTLKLSVSEIYRLGARFVLNSVTLGAALYAEQLVVVRIAPVDHAAIYFSHAAYFMFPVLFVNGYGGFKLGPWLRRNKKMFEDFITRRWHVVIMGVLIYVGASHGVMTIVWGNFMPSSTGIDYKLQAFFFLSGIAVTLYAIPSAYTGVFSPAHHQTRLLVGQWFAASVAGVAVWFTVLRGDASIIYAIAGISALHWLMRTLVSGVMMAAIWGDGTHG
jgi:hypothetical protein